MKMTRKANNFKTVPPRASNTADLFVSFPWSFWGTDRGKNLRRSSVFEAEAGQEGKNKTRQSKAKKKEQKKKENNKSSLSDKCKLKPVSSPTSFVFLLGQKKLQIRTQLLKKKNKNKKKKRKKGATRCLLFTRRSKRKCSVK